MEQIIQLEQTELVTERPFTNPQHSFKDAEITHYMLDRLHAIITRSNEPPRDELGLIRITSHEKDGSAHRIIIVDWQTLQTQNELATVGFFGQIREGIDHTPIMDIENVLIDQLANYPGLLGYYNLHLPQKGFGNLVLFRDPTVKETWRTNPIHIHAAELTPQHYYSLRLHNGTLPGGLLSHHDFVLARTKYYDFTGPETWRAVREFV